MWRRVNDEHAKELLGWMFAQDQRGETVLGESRRLKDLAAVVASDRALAELRRNSNLDQSYVFTSGPGEAFAQRLDTAEKAISDCVTLLGESLEPDDHHSRQVARIIDNAENLQLLIHKAVNQRNKRARQSKVEDVGDV